MCIHAHLCVYVYLKKSSQKFWLRRCKIIFRCNLLDLHSLKPLVARESTFIFSSLRAYLQKLCSASGEPTMCKSKSLFSFFYRGLKTWIPRGSQESYGRNCDETSSTVTDRHTCFISCNKYYCQPWAGCCQLFLWIAIVELKYTWTHTSVSTRKRNWPPSYGHFLLKVYH